MEKCSSHCFFYPRFDKIPEYKIDKHGVKHVIYSKYYRCDCTDERIVNGMLCPFFRKNEGITT